MNFGICVEIYITYIMRKFQFFGWSIEKVMKFWENCEVLKKLCSFINFQVIRSKLQKVDLLSFLYCPNLWYLFVCSGLRPKKRLRIGSWRLPRVPIGFRTAAFMIWFLARLYARKDQRVIPWMSTSMPTLAWHPRGCVGIFWIAISYACYSSCNRLL